MACSQTLAGFTSLSCTPSKGGVKRVLIANYDDIEGFAESSGVITGITMESGKTFHEYVMRRNTASMTSTLNFDETAGVNFVSTDVVLRFNKLDTPQRIEMSALVLAETTVIVEDANGKYWLLGKDEPIVPSAGSANTGTQKTDGSYYELTLQSSDDTWPMEVSASAITGILPA